MNSPENPGANESALASQNTPETNTWKETRRAQGRTANLGDNAPQTEKPAPQAPRAAETTPPASADGGEGIIIGDPERIAAKIATDEARTGRNTNEKYAATTLGTEQTPAENQPAPVETTPPASREANPTSQAVPQQQKEKAETPSSSAEEKAKPEAVSKEVDNPEVARRREIADAMQLEERKRKTEEGIAKHRAAIDVLNQEVQSGRKGFKRPIEEINAEAAEHEAVIYKLEAEKRQTEREEKLNKIAQLEQAITQAQAQIAKFRAQIDTTPQQPETITGQEERNEEEQKSAGEETAAFPIQQRQERRSALEKSIVLGNQVLAKLNEEMRSGTSKRLKEEIEADIAIHKLGIAKDRRDLAALDLFDFREQQARAQDSVETTPSEVEETAGEEAGANPEGVPLTEDESALGEPEAFPGITEEDRIALDRINGRSTELNNEMQEAGFEQGTIRKIGEWWSKRPAWVRIGAGVGLIAGAALVGGPVGSALYVGAMAGRGILTAAATFYTTEKFLRNSKEKQEKWWNKYPTGTATILGIAAGFGSAYLLGGLDGSDEAVTVANQAAENVGGGVTVPIPDVTAEAMPIPDSGDVAPSAPDVPTIDYPPHEVVSGENVWGIIENHPALAETLAGLSPEQQTFVIDGLKDSLQAMSPDQLREIGISSGNIDLIHPGDQIDLNALFDQPADRDYISALRERALGLNSGQLENIRNFTLRS